jgi:hypothetical protein
VSSRSLPAAAVFPLLGMVILTVSIVVDEVEAKFTNGTHRKMQEMAMALTGTWYLFVLPKKASQVMGEAQLPGSRCLVSPKKVLDATYSSVFAAVKAVMRSMAIMPLLRPGIPDSCALRINPENPETDAFWDWCQLTLGNPGSFDSTFRLSRSPATKYITVTMKEVQVAENLIGIL